MHEQTNMTSTIMVHMYVMVKEDFITLKLIWVLKKANVIIIMCCCSEPNNKQTANGIPRLRVLANITQCVLVIAKSFLLLPIIHTNWVLRLRSQFQPFSQGSQANIQINFPYNTIHLHWKLIHFGINICYQNMTASQQPLPRHDPHISPYFSLAAKVENMLSYQIEESISTSLDT